jgi:hypothetical protein
MKKKLPKSNSKKVSNKSKKGLVRNATSIEFDNIKFKSKLELYCYQRLKEENLPINYESIVITIIPEFIFAYNCYEHDKRKKDLVESKKVGRMTYKPDFTGTTNSRKWIIECKGYPNMAFPVRWKILKYVMAERGYDYDLYLPSSKKEVDEVIKKIKNENRN